MKITLKTLPQATAREVFEQVKAHLLQQKRRSIALPPSLVPGSCAYRGENGLKCAAGCLISDEEYDPKIEGSIWPPSSEYPTEHRALIRRLQAIHDRTPVDLWEARLAEIEKELEA